MSVYSIFDFRFSIRGICRSIAAILTAFVCLVCPATASASDSSDRPTVLVVVGAPGEDEFGSNFLHQAETWKEACKKAECRCITLGLNNGPTNDFEMLKQTLEAEPKEGLGQLWLVLIGHGSFDGKEAKFNLRGPDVSTTNLVQWLQPFRRPLAIIDTSSASAPFLAKVSGTNRVIVTATRSGNERNYARFGKYFAEAIGDSRADLDKDGEVSLLEAFLTASRNTAEFYKVQSRLATEHALIDDNGDGLGTPADWFRGTRAVKKAKDNAALDGLLAQQFRLIPGEAERRFTPEQRAQRDALERAVFSYREKKGRLSEDEYYKGLEPLLLQLARFYESNSASPSPVKSP